eukprot:10784744-Lingulodinium_polyedra.AAC.1
MKQWHSVAMVIMAFGIITDVYKSRYDVPWWRSEEGGRKQGPASASEEEAHKARVVVASAASSSGGASSSKEPTSATQPGPGEKPAEEGNLHRK